MSTPTTIRDATLRDIAAITALLAELYAHEGMQVVPNADALTQALFVEARDVQLRALVAQAGEQVVGALLYYSGYDTTSASYGYHLADMVISAPHRAQGVGKALVAELSRHALAQHYQWISLTALGRNASAVAFYQSLGMQEVDVRFFAIGATGLTTLSLTKGK